MVTSVKNKYQNRVSCRLINVPSNSVVFYVSSLQDPVKEVAALQLLQGHCQHGNVEELKEAMADDTTLYKVTPWYEGGELFDLAPMNETAAKRVFAQILEALDYVHSRGQSEEHFLTISSIFVNYCLPVGISSKIHSLP